MEILQRVVESSRNPRSKFGVKEALYRALVEPYAFLSAEGPADHLLVVH